MALFEYSEWDGSQEFTPLAAEAAFDRLSEYLMEHGEYVLRQLEKLDDEEADVLKMLIKEGFLEKDEKGRLVVAPKGLRRVETKALDELFQITRKDMPGKHPSDFKGAGQVRHEDNKPYEFGDPVANLDLHKTLKKAVIREGREAAPRPEAGRRAGKVGIREEDFVV